MTKALGIYKVFHLKCYLSAIIGLERLPDQEKDQGLKGLNAVLALSGSRSLAQKPGLSLAIKLMGENCG